MVAITAKAGTPVVVVELKPQSWPSDIPSDFLRDGFRMSPLRTEGRFPVDRGPDMRRRRFTKSIRLIQGVVVMTPDQWTDLKEFYRDRLGEGVEKFLFPNPQGSGDVEVRFTAPPDRRPRRANWAVSVSLRTT